MPRKKKQSAEAAVKQIRRTLLGIGGALGTLLLIIALADSYRSAVSESSNPLASHGDTTASKGSVRGIPGRVPDPATGRNRWIAGGEDNERIVELAETAPNLAEVIVGSLQVGDYERFEMLDRWAHGDLVGDFGDEIEDCYQRYTASIKRACGWENRVVAKRNSPTRAEIVYINVEYPEGMELEDSCLALSRCVGEKWRGREVDVPEKDAFSDGDYFPLSYVANPCVPLSRGNHDQSEAENRRKQAKREKRLFENPDQQALRHNLLGNLHCLETIAKLRELN